MKNFTLLLFLLGAVCAAGQSVVINEVYGAGGNTGALFTHDYVELFNASPSPLDLTGWSIQYASAASTGTWQVTALAGSIEAGRHFLIQLGGGSGNGQPLPLPDLVGTTAMAATAGKLALVQGVTALSGGCPSSPLIIDRVGYGSSATCFEGTGPAPAPSAVLAVVRQTDGADSNNNATDFGTRTPSPKNSLPRRQAIMFGSLTDRTYGDAPFLLSATATSGLPVTFETSDAGIADVSGSLLTIRGTGDVVIAAKQAGNAFFAPATAVQNLHVARATLAVTVDPVTRPQGDSNPSFLLRYTGFVGQDTESSLDVLPVATCLAGPGSLPGNYEISISGGSDNNYMFVYTSNILTVVPVQPIAPVYAVSPVDGAAEVSPFAGFKAAYTPGATTYTMQVSRDPAFSAFSERQGGRTLYFSDLAYATRYYLRVRTNLSPVFGRVTTFTTVSPDKVTVLKSPGPNTPGVGLSPYLRFDEVRGASQFFLEVSEQADFSTVVVSQAGPRQQLVRGLVPGTTYYVRAHTELSSVWGPVRSFRTAPLNELCYVGSPGARSERVSWLPEIRLNQVGATAYTVQLSESDDFAAVIEYAGVPHQFVVSSSLKFRTRYFARVRDAAVAEAWGPVRSFVTSHPSDFAHLKYPADGAREVSPEVTFVAAVVPTASQYEIALSRDPTFKNVDTVVTTPNRSRLLELAPHTTWYARVRTELSPEWGRVTSFATASGEIGAAMPGEEAHVPFDADSQRERSGLEFAVWPNPFVETLNIRCTGESGPLRITVTDVTGRLVWSGDGAAGRTLHVGAGWAPGMYVVRIQGTGGAWVWRVVKEALGPSRG